MGFDDGFDVLIDGLLSTDCRLGCGMNLCSFGVLPGRDDVVAFKLDANYVV